MELNIEVLESGKVIKLTIRKDLLRILIDSTSKYISAVRTSYEFEHNKEGEKSIRIAEEILVDLMLHNTYAKTSEIKFEMDFEHFKELKDIVVVCSTEVLGEDKKLAGKIQRYKEFGANVEVGYREYSSRMQKFNKIMN